MCGLQCWPNHRRLQSQCLKQKQLEHTRTSLYIVEQSSTQAPRRKDKNFWSPANAIGWPGCIGHSAGASCASQTAQTPGIGEGRFADMNSDFINLQYFSVPPARHRRLERLPESHPAPFQQHQGLSKDWPLPNLRRALGSRCLWQVGCKHTVSVAQPISAPCCCRSRSTTTRSGGVYVPLQIEAIPSYGRIRHAFHEPSKLDACTRSRRCSSRV